MTMFFSDLEGARRYETFRPKVHGVVVNWLALHCGPVRWNRGLDVACGTGDSTVPLLEICDDVLGIDSSEAMLHYARAKGLKVRQASVDAFHPENPFDLISTCMAFHWFDPVSAIRSYKAMSSNEAIWIIYNFGFAGHSCNALFNSWFHDKYLSKFPSPPRNRMASVVPRDDADITLIAEDCGDLLIDFTPEVLVGYLSTQSNIEYAIKNGADYTDICEDLLEQVRKYDLEGQFRYSFSYEIHRYNKSQQAGAANPCAFGTSGTEAACAPSAPEASRDT